MTRPTGKADSDQQGKPGPAGIHFLMPVWGEPYVTSCLEASIPSYLSPGNLGSWSKEANNRFTFYCSSDDAELIHGAAVFARLGEHIETRVHVVDDELRRCEEEGLSKRWVMTESHRIGLEAAARERAAFVPLYSDLVLGDGALSSMVRIARTGKRLIIYGCFTTVAETFVPALLKGHRSDDGCVIDIPPRDLVKLGMEHIHPDIKNFFADSETFSNHWPAWLFFDVPGEGFIERGFHLGQLLIDPVNRDETMEFERDETIDCGSYVMRAVPDFADHHISNDSDEIAVVSFQPMGQRMLDDHLLVKQRMSITHQAWWLHNHANRYIASLCKTPIRFHTGDLTPAFEAAVQRSDRVVRQLFDLRDLISRCPEVDQDIGRMRDDLKACRTEVGTLARGRAQLLQEAALAYYRLGVELHRAGSPLEAHNALQKATGMWPDVQLMLDCVQRLAQHGLTAPALETLRLALQHVPGDQPEVAASLQAMERRLAGAMGGDGP